jgi:transcriptional regulator with XRE-family HTH domain
VSTENLTRKRLVGANIRQARKRSKMSLDTLAAQAGTSRQHLIRLEQGLHMPGPELLQRIADAIGTAASDLVPEDEAEAAAMADPRDFAAAMVEIFDRRYGFDRRVT